MNSKQSYASLINYEHLEAFRTCYYVTALVWLYINQTTQLAKTLFYKIKFI